MAWNGPTIAVLGLGVWQAYDGCLGAERMLAYSGKENRFSRCLTIPLDRGALYR
jgi:hypothetical protein